jgi:putative toxin-antitoxin system antitoxin component (TIGR02293 family)
MSTVKSPTNTTYRARAQSHNAGLREPSAAYEVKANQAALRPAKTLRNVGKVAEKPHADTSAKPLRHTKFGLTVLPKEKNSTLQYAQSEFDVDRDIKPRNFLIDSANMDDSDAPLEDLAMHDLVTRGLPIADVRALMERFQIIAQDTILSTLGVSERTLQRADASGKTLDSNVSDRALRLSAVTDQAITVLGNQDAAEHWLLAPALGLSQRRPIDLLQSTEGTNMVKTLLTRMDYGVYS